MALKLSMCVGILVAFSIIVMIILPIAFHRVDKADGPKNEVNIGSNEAAAEGAAVSTDDRATYLKTMNSLDYQVAIPNQRQHHSEGQGERKEQSIDLSSLDASSIAIVQFDSRSISGNTYWTTSALWNRHYCSLHGHKYLYYTLKGGKGSCRSHSGEELADPWCKVKSMLAANDEHPSIKVFIYMDSDAVLDKKFAEKPLQELLGTMQKKLRWDPREKPTVFNQDGPCWWCDLVESSGYKTCLNAGTVVWYRHERSKRTLLDWWRAAMDSYEGNPIRRAFRLKWPWEQDRQMALFNRTPEHIQVASQPEKLHMDMRAGHHDWCLSHLARSGCFISHFCEGSHSKMRMKERYDGKYESGGLDSSLFYL
jgi:hypothetical protein